MNYLIKNNLALLIFLVPFLLSLLAFFGDIRINGYISILLFMAFLHFIYTANKLLFFSNIFFWVSWVWVMSSLIFIEQGAFITEQNRFGVQIGSPYKFFLYIFSFSISGILLFHLNRNNHKKMSKFFREKNSDYDPFYFFLVLFFVLLICFSLAYAMNGLPLLLAIERFSYWEGIEVLRRAVYVTPIATFFLGMSFAHTKKIFKVLILILLCGILFLFGEKFTGPYLNIAYFFTGYYLVSNLKHIDINYGFERQVIFIWGPLLFISLTILVAIGYLILNSFAADEVADQIIQRALGLQGHTWYGVDYNLMNGHIQHQNDLFLKEYSSEYPAGMESIMYSISNSDFVKATRDLGIRFTNGYPAIVLLSFGFDAGLVAQFFLGFIFFIFYFYMIRTICFGQHLRLFMFLVFFNNILTNVFLEGEIFYVFRPLSMIIVFLMFIDVLFFKFVNIKNVFYKHN